MGLFPRLWFRFLLFFSLKTADNFSGVVLEYVEKAHCNSWSEKSSLGFVEYQIAYPVLEFSVWSQ